MSKAGGPIIWDGGKKMELATFTSKQRPVVSTDRIEVQIDNLKSLIKNPPSTSRVCHFGPELATYIIENLNVGNRSPKPRQIRVYADDMANDNWSVTGVPIVFATNGQLLDGQNRLMAAVRAGVPFTTHVVFGVEPQSFVHFDIGKTRTNMDVFQIMGAPYPLETSKFVKLYQAYSQGSASTRSLKMTNDEMRSFYNDFVDQDLLVLAIKHSKKVAKNVKFPTAHLTCLFYIAAQNGHLEKVKQFMVDMETNFGAGPRSPVRMLLETVARMRMDPTLSLSSQHYGVLLTRAWSNYKAGKASVKADMVVRSDDSIAEI